MRPVLPALAASALLLAALTACTSDGGTESSKACEPLAAGAVSQAITVTDVDGGEPTVDFSAPLDVEGSERSVTTEGDGDQLADGDTFSLEFAVYNGTSGEKIGSTGFTGDTPVEPKLDATQLPGALYDVFKCSHEGDTIVAAISADDSADLGFTQDGSDPTPLVFLAEVGDKVEAEKLPTPGPWTENVPEVDLSGDVPAVTIPDTEAPTDLLLQVLTQGDGEVVEEGDTVTMNYELLKWSAKTVEQESFSSEPFTSSTAPGSLVTGFTAAVVGQKVGSTVIVNVPAELGYGTEATSNGLGGEDLVFVIEIQKAESAG